MEITDTISTKSLQNFVAQVNILNSVDIDIENDKLWNFIARCKKDNFSYKFILESLLFSCTQ